MARLSPNEPFLHDDVVIVNTTFGRYCEVGRGSRVLNSEFGDYAYCDQRADIANTTLGKFANVAAATRIGPTDHPYANASLHHFLYRSASYWDDVEDDADFFARRAARRTVIGHDTWIGHGAIIKPEVTIGNGAIVAAGAMVTKDVAPYMIVAGVPAVPLRARYPDGVADRIEALAWWNWDHDRLRAALDDFRTLDAAAFCDRYEA
ncbi:chloramphenicol acetyltransferase [Oceanicola sp. 22II-s10i]|uniref:chloramphenicol acetyltransferase n=1 Tax=Oceanicola sp. 22II-s10i TaxID=1317116 RepID=UPI000B523F2F|nr:chloramphenicol acetyltransferase [Oceanicola sp. 22II-s10i]OWU85002.1 chloramphenicol acetyltransferase [Oceanicola sp. 22II-s10i]